MSENKQPHVNLKFLQDQLRWCQERDSVLQEIESKLYEMKGIAEYASEHELSSAEIGRLNHQLGVLKNEIDSLEKHLDITVH